MAAVTTAKCCSRSPRWPAPVASSAPTTNSSRCNARIRSARAPSASRDLASPNAEIASSRLPYASVCRSSLGTRPPYRSPVSPPSPPLVTMLNGSDRLEECRVFEVGRLILASALPILDPFARRYDRGGCIADRGGDLAGQLAADVAGRKDAGNAGHHRHRVGEVVARGVMVDVHVDERGVRDEPDEDEDTADGELTLLIAVHVAQREPLHTVCSVD